VKAQVVRLLDVFALGPLMVSVATRAEGIPDWQRIALLWTGIGTILYNAANFLERRGG
jgi:hypothetical protein